MRVLGLSNLSSPAAHSLAEDDMAHDPGTSRGRSLYVLCKTSGFLWLISRSCKAAAFACRQVTYLLGDSDSLDNAHLDQSCEANAQVLDLQSLVRILVLRLWSGGELRASCHSRPCISVHTRAEHKNVPESLESVALWDVEQDPLACMAAGELQAAEGSCLLPVPETD